MLPPLKAAALLVEACGCHLLSTCPSAAGAGPHLDFLTKPWLLSWQPLPGRRSGCQTLLFVRSRRHCGFHPRPGDSPDGLTSCSLGVGRAWLLCSLSLASGFADMALIHPLPGWTACDRGEGERREMHYSPWEHLQKQDSCYLLAFSVSVGPQSLPGKLKAHIAGPSLSF